MGRSAKSALLLMVQLTHAGVATQRAIRRNVGSEIFRRDLIGANRGNRARIAESPH